MRSINRDHASPGASPVPQDADRFLWGFPLFAIGCEIFLAVLNYLERINGGALTVMLSFFVLIALGMTVVALVGIVALIKGKFKRAASLLLAPFIVASPLLLPILPYEDFAFDWLRFLFTKEKYAQVIDRMSPAERASRIVFFDWGATGFAGIANSAYWLVYDESGEIALPEQKRSRAWQERVNKEKPNFSGEKCPAVIYRLSGHYYSAITPCL
jgi:hypothetical protein